MKNRVMYLALDNRRVGCLAMSVDRITNRVRYALSVVHDTDTFDRQYAQELAFRRLRETPREVALPPEANGHQISMAVLRNVSRWSEAPTKARAAADKWLRLARAKTAG